MLRTTEKTESHQKKERKKKVREKRKSSIVPRARVCVCVCVCVCARAHTHTHTHTVFRISYSLSLSQPPPPFLSPSRYYVEHLSVSVYLVSHFACDSLFVHAYHIIVIILCNTKPQRTAHTDMHVSGRVQEGLKASYTSS